MMHRTTRYRSIGIIYGPNARTETIRKLVARITAETGRSPTDSEVAKMLACSEARIRRHRAMLAATPTTKG